MSSRDAYNQGNCQFTHCPQGVDPQGNMFVQKSMSELQMCDIKATEGSESKACAMHILIAFEGVGQRTSSISTMRSAEVASCPEAASCETSAVGATTAALEPATGCMTVPELGDSSSTHSAL